MPQHLSNPELITGSRLIFPGFQWRVKLFGCCVGTFVSSLCAGWGWGRELGWGRHQQHLPERRWWGWDAHGALMVISAKSTPNWGLEAGAGFGVHSHCLVPRGRAAPRTQWVLAARFGPHPPSLCSPLCAPSSRLFPPEASDHTEMPLEGAHWLTQAGCRAGAVREASSCPQPLGISVPGQQLHHCSCWAGGS